MEKEKLLDKDIREPLFDFIEDLLWKQVCNELFERDYNTIEKPLRNTGKAKESKRNRRGIIWGKRS